MPGSSDTKYGDENSRRLLSQVVREAKARAEVTPADPDPRDQRIMELGAECAKLDGLLKAKEQTIEMMRGLQAHSTELSKQDGLRMRQLEDEVKAWAARCAALESKAEVIPPAPVPAISEAPQALAGFVVRYGGGLVVGPFNSREGAEKFLIACATESLCSARVTIERV